MQFDEQPQKSSGKTGIDVPRGLVGKQEFRAHDERAGDRRALLLAAGKHGRRSVHAVAEPDPAQELDDLGAVVDFVRPRARNGSATFS